MFGFRLSWVFRSRWLALVWCGLIVWMAVDLIGPDAGDGNNQAAANVTDITGAPVSQHDLDVLRNFAEGH
jgi:hypothetical protein